MSQVIQFRPSPPTAAHPADIATLSARLLQVESAETSDEDMLDLLLEAEVSMLAALAEARAATLTEAGLKLAAVVRRVGEGRDEPLSECETALLQSTLQDLQRLAVAPAPAAAATA